MSTATQEHEASVERTNKIANIFSVIVIPIGFIVSVLIFMFVFGDPQNFIDNDPANNPKQGNYLGVIYKGGWVVTLLMTCLFTVIVFSIERFITISRAKGRGSIARFVKRVQYHLNAEDINAARAECDKQRGSVANVVRSGLDMYERMMRQPDLSKDQKILAIQKEVEEATALELPMLQKNLPIIATLAPIGTLVGLFGTVLGMVKAFAALATAGAPDAVGLATGISEALINTAAGVGASALAIIAYNMFTTRIDQLTYAIDEAGYSLAQTFAQKH